jgi:hypothetical protein
MWQSDVKVGMWKCSGTISRNMFTFMRDLVGNVERRKPGNDL